MTFILFVMLFTSQPASPDVWALQGTNSMEFQTEDACQKAGEEIDKDVKTTDTVRIAAYCFAKGGEPKAIQRLIAPQ